MQSKIFSIVGITAALLMTAPVSDALAKPKAAPVKAEQTEGKIVPLDRIAAVVNNDVITEIELQQRIHQTAMNLRRQGINLPPMENLREQLLERMILDRIIEQRAKDAGIKIDDQMIAAAVEQIARNNNLTVPQLQDRLAKDGVSFREFQGQVRNEILMQRLREKDVDDTIKVSESEVDQYIKEQMKPENMREYHLARIVIALPENATQEKMNAIQRTASMVLDQAKRGADFGQLAAKYSQAQEAMNGGDLGWKTGNHLPSALFDAVKGHNQGEVIALRTPNSLQILKVLGTRDNGTGSADMKVEQTHVRHIMLRPTDVTPEKVVIERLNEIKGKLDRGESDFASLARLYSADPSGTRGGDLGWVYPGDLHPVMEQTVAKLKKGDISEPTKTPYGWHIFQVLDRRTQSGINDRIRMQAREALREQKTGDAVIEWERKLREEAYVEKKNPKPQE